MNVPADEYYLLCRIATAVAIGGEQLAKRAPELAAEWKLMRQKTSENTNA